jgi:hypothetical protein
MAVSPLATEAYPADPSNYSDPEYRTNITAITIHHMAGVLSAAACGGIFQRPGRNGSSHYGIGVDGEIAWYVDEDCVAWTNSDWSSNQCSVTIENSNCDTGGDWPVSDATLNSCIKLVADIAKRNGLGHLVPGQNLTWHSMFAATSCPGDYLRDRMQYIADEANKINEGQPTPPTPPTPTPGIQVGDEVVLKEWVDYNGTPLRQTRDYYFVSEINGDRAVLRADSMDGTVYCAANVNNLVKVGEAPAPEPTPEPQKISVGDKVVPINWVDYNGTPLRQTRDFYYVMQINGDRAVLTADSMDGTVYAAVNVNNLRKV